MTAPRIAQHTHKHIPTARHPLHFAKHKVKTQEICNDTVAQQGCVSRTALLTASNRIQKTEQDNTSWCVGTQKQTNANSTKAFTLKLSLYFHGHGTPKKSLRGVILQRLAPFTRRRTLNSVNMPVSSTSALPTASITPVSRAPAVAAPPLAAKGAADMSSSEEPEPNTLCGSVSCIASFLDRPAHAICRAS